METDQAFDAHCHVFDLEYLLLEVEQMLLDALRGKYPIHRATKLTAVLSRGELKNIIEQIKNFLKWIYELYGAAMGDEKRNTDFLFSTGKDVFNRDISIVPLMMDIYFMFGPSLPSKKSILSSLFHGSTHKAELKAVGDIQVEFENIMMSAVEEFKTRTKLTDTKGPIGNIIALVESTMKKALAFQLRDSSKDPYLKTVGFEHQLEKIIELKGIYPDRVYPFLAIDPRRDGLINYVNAGNYISKDGPFLGAKLYPRLGYRPDISALDPLYDRCEALDVPVTTHCSIGGFPPPSLFKNWKYDVFGAPENYIPVMTNHNKLRLDLAHFGNNEDDRTWAKTIASMMKTFATEKPNESRLFSDLACYSASDNSDLNRWWKDFSTNELAKNQTMFGSDFDVMYFTAIMPLDTYYKRFNGSAGIPLPIETMMGATVRRFLG